MDEKFLAGVKRDFKKKYSNDWSDMKEVGQAKSLSASFCMNTQNNGEKNQVLCVMMHPINTIQLTTVERICIDLTP